MINVGFLFAHEELSHELARAMIASVREQIPGARVVQLSDEKTPEVAGIDDIRREPVPDGDVIMFRCNTHMNLAGDWLILDYDCWVQRDVSKIFQRNSFDIALTRRPLIDPTASEAAHRASPHNFGVIFQRERGQLFWRQMVLTYNSLRPEHRDGWIMGQACAPLAIEKIKDRIFVLELPGEYYNYTPQRQEEDLRARAIVHYKGHRKNWMLQRAGYSKEESERICAAGEKIVNDYMKRYATGEK